VPRLNCGEAAKPVGYRKPTEFIQDPSPLKTTEDLSPEERGSAPGGPLRGGVTKTAGFSAEWMVSNIQITVHKLCGAVHRHFLSMLCLPSRFAIVCADWRIGIISLPCSGILQRTCDRLSRIADNAPLYVWRIHRRTSDKSQRITRRISPHTLSRVT
jgi:hypothetical protein